MIHRRQQFPNRIVIVEFVPYLTLDTAAHRIVVVEDHKESASRRAPLHSKLLDHHVSCRIAWESPNQEHLSLTLHDIQDNPHQLRHSSVMAYSIRRFLVIALSVAIRMDYAALF